MREVAPKLRYARPLICVFPAYTLQLLPGVKEPSAIMNGTICGLVAPRRVKGDRSAPKYPNRFGEPLCVLHRADGDDILAFPDAAGVPSAASYEAAETTEKFRERLRRLSEL